MEPEQNCNKQTPIPSANTQVSVIKIGKFYCKLFRVRMASIMIKTNSFNYNIIDHNQIQIVYSLDIYLNIHKQMFVHIIYLVCSKLDIT
jgi:hypothetical protein